MRGWKLLGRAAALTLLAALVVGPSVAAAASDSAVEAAREYVKSHKQELGLTGSDIKELAVSDVVLSRHSGVTHVYLQQLHKGIEVFNGVINVNVLADGSVLSAGNRAVANIAAAAAGQSPRKAADDAAGSAAKALGLKSSGFSVLERKGGASQAATLSRGGVTSLPVEAKLTWAPVGDGVRLAWHVDLEPADGDHAWDALVDAESGALLEAYDRVVHDDVHAIAAAISRPASAKAALPSFPPTDGAQYRVYPMPFMSPSDGDRSLVANAADPFASPFGWHDTDGAAGPEFTITRGNNAHAYEDRNDNNVADVGSAPDGGPGLLFDFPLDLTAPPAASIPAFVTNLFYWNNIVHDVFYGYGFDEVSGNFQANNYGKGGNGADYVQAEAQDGSGGNNANFQTNADNGTAGSRPRMQMFEWRSTAPNPIDVHPPSAIAGRYFGPMAGFGPSLGTTGPQSGQVVLVDDGSTAPVNPGAIGTIDDGCQAFTVPAGSIALVVRGGCNFTLKIINGQNTGAIAVIVGNNIPGPPTGMSGTGNEFRAARIPSVMISQSDYAIFKPAAPFNATITDGTNNAIHRDSDVDAGVIAHEYGHGISNRLTGGPSRVNCLNNVEQMGEGWSDFVGLTLTTTPTDTPVLARGIGTYVSFQPNDGNGIRPTPYSTDMSVDPATYAAVADTVNISQPHGIGYVWNSMLWEVYWNLVDKHGYNADVYAPWNEGGNNLAIQLVMDGMKIQPCSPGFVDGRDAILAADVALTGGVNQCEIWRGFAKRGLGAGASQGSSNNRTDGVESFALPAACSATFGGFDSPLGGGLNEANAGSTVPLKFTVSGMGSETPRIDSQPIDCETQLIEGGPVVPIELPGNSQISRDGDVFHANWKTDPSWSGTCRKVTVRLAGASDGTAVFRFL